MIKPNRREEPTRRSIYLKTKDLEKAMSRRDRIIAAIADAGLLGQVRDYPARIPRIDETAENGRITA